MPNWAITTYKIEGEQSVLEEINQLITDFQSGHRSIEGAAPDWEGNIIKALGIPEEESYLRGFFQFHELENGVLTITAEEAWGDTDFRHLLRKKYPQLRIYYITEEDGLEYYATNDSEEKYFSDRFRLSSCIDEDYQYEYFQTKEDALKYIAEHFHLHSEKEIEDFNNNSAGNYIYINEYKLTES